MRWLRTIRSVRPGGYACCFITFSLPMVVLGATPAGFAPMALIRLGITVAARLVLHFHRHAGNWRRERFGVGRGGSLHRIGQQRVP